MQGLPFQVLHHHVSGAAFLKQVQHPHDVRMVEPRQHPRFLGKALFSLLPPSQVEGGRRMNRVSLAHSAVRKHFLDGKTRPQQHLRDGVGDPEPPLAQHLIDAVLALQEGADRQRL